MATTVIQEPTSFWSGSRLTILNKRTYTLLQELDQMPGAQRALICDNRGVPLAVWLTAEFARETSDRVGACLATILTSFRGLKFREVELRFENRLLYVRALGNAFIAITCASDTNLPLLRMTLNVAAAPFEADKGLQDHLAIDPQKANEALLRRTGGFGYSA